MLANASVTTMLPVKDMNRARAFYEGRLGLKAGNFKPDGKFEYAVGGSTLALFPKPEGTKAEHTAISFRVDDITASVAGLKRAGVVFEDYDFPDFKTVAWIRGLARRGFTSGALAGAMESAMLRPLHKGQHAIALPPV